MKVNALEAENFRNFSALRFEAGDGIHVIYGLSLIHICAIAVLFIVFSVCSAPDFGRNS